jgi:uncharacterized repeat protein (TIGR01451 family)
MKRSLLLGLGALAIISAVPFMTNTPVLADLQKAGETLIKAINKPEIKLNLVASKQVMEKNADGVEVVTWKSLADGAVVHPGDVLRYTVDSQNVGNLPASNLVVTQPIPAKTVYVLASARSNNGAKITYSIDQGKNFVEQPMISVVNEKGELELVPAPAEQYTHVRWNFEKNIDPAIGVKAMYDVKVP